MSYRFLTPFLALDLAVPFVARDDIQLSQRGDELTLQVGPFKRKTLLPRALTGRPVLGARFVDRRLHIRFGERSRAAAAKEG
jgi:arsenite-transporting ATPase